MVPVRLGPVGHKLELLFALNQGTIATGNTQSIAERIGCAAVVAVEVELAKPGGEGVAEIRVRNSEGGHRR